MKAWVKNWLAAALAEALALDDGTIRALVEIIFSQKDDRAPLS